MRTISSVLLSTLVLGGPVFAAAEQKTPLASPEAGERVAQADQLIRKGSFDEALSRYIEPTIAEFEKQYSGRAERVYCARDGAETVYYLAQSAEKGRSAVVLSQAYAYAYYLKGYILIDRNQFDAALPCLLKAVELSPGNAQYLSELGHVYQSNKDWPKSLETFDRAIEGARAFSGDDNHHAELRRALRGRGYCLVELQRYDEAEKIYAECLELDPNDATAKGELGYIKDLRAKQAPTK